MSPTESKFYSTINQCKANTLAEQGRLIIKCASFSFQRFGGSRFILKAFQRPMSELIPSFFPFIHVHSIMQNIPDHSLDFKAGLSKAFSCLPPFSFHPQVSR